MIINAMIPARMGSTRLKMKNLALLNGKPMISYAINAAKESKVFNNIFVNSENSKFLEISDRYGVDFYHRSDSLGSSETKSDDVVYDFMKNNPGDITVWVNSTSPLQTGDEIKRIVNYFIENKLDSLITVRDEQVHCLLGGEPMNYNITEQFAQTQDLKPVSRFVYSVMMWRNNTFIDKMEKNGSALFCGKTGYFSVSKETSIIVKTEEDFYLIDNILKGREQNKDWNLTYDDICHS
jgi:CMP-N-acetylneuraminic acid synthetase